MVYFNICDFIFSAHQSKEARQALASEQLVQARGIDERVGTQVDESNHCEPVIQAGIIVHRQAAFLGHKRELDRQPTNSEK